jgi:GntR family transcriptional regulator
MAPEIERARPAYLQIADAIRERILRGDLRPGEGLPSERDLARQWGVTRPTITRALGVLKAAGVAEARQGSGTYVAEAPPPPFRRGGSSEDLDSSPDRAVLGPERHLLARRTGRVYREGESARIEDVGPVPAPPEVAAALRLAPGAQAIRRRRLIVGPDGPLELSSSWIDPRLAALAPALLALGPIPEGTLLHLEGASGRRAHWGEARAGARLADATEASALGLSAPAAVLVVRQLAIDGEGLPLELSEGVYPAGRWAVLGG